MDRQGILIVVSGFSGAGKGTIMKKLVEDHQEYALSVSATTRNPRPGEENGKDYFFLSRPEFEEKIRQNQFIEYASYVNNYYGTPKTYVEQKLAEGKDVILEIEIQGAHKVREQYPEALLLFVTPPSIGELKRRLNERHTESAEVVESRIKRAGEEAEGMEWYDYLIINDNLEQCVTEVHRIIQGEHRKCSRNLEFINILKEELKGE